MDNLYTLGALLWQTYTSCGNVKGIDENYKKNGTWHITHGKYQGQSALLPKKNLCETVYRFLGQKETLSMFFLQKKTEFFYSRVILAFIDPQLQAED